MRAAWLARPRQIGGVLAAALLLSGCGGGGGYGGGYGNGGMPQSYTIGGTITGLVSSGLVLANGYERVSPAAGATSFTFATVLASGANYTVTVKTQPNNEMCQVANGTGQVGSAAVTNVSVTCAVPTTYSIGGTITGLTAAGLMLANGSDTVSPAAGATTFKFATALASGSSYGVTVQTQPAGQVCDVSNASGTVVSAAVTNVVVSCAGIWTWLSGQSTVRASGFYGLQGVARAGTRPGARNASVSWIDGAGNLWLFGGAGLAASWTHGFGQLNDLWRYSPATGEWTWVSGTERINARGAYGTQGVAAAANVPGGRNGSVSWIDSAGNLWLFGGIGYDSAGTFGDLNDLWRYSPATGQWTWVSGANTVNAPSVYGTQGVAAAANVPGARTYSVSWIDSAGELWLFGGAEPHPAGALGELNDLWRYSPATGQWTWVSGANTVNALGVYGTQGMAAAANVPGARDSSLSWIDSAGNLWLFGGGGYDSAGTADDLNDLWRYSPGTGEWTWVSGANRVDARGVYGTQGVAAGANVPGARDSGVSWIDSAGNLWLFGGFGYDSTGGGGLINDLWRYTPGTGEWTWVRGANTVYALGVYGTAADVPGARDGAVSWIDSAGKLWLFGGIGVDSAGATDVINDMWVYDVR
jgi:N-acetylneuraminic acid mutarotase